MKTFITGATGFIGTEVVRRFTNTPHQLVCLVRRPEAAPALEATGAEVVFGDVTRPWTVVEGMRGCEAVIHLAAAFDFWKPDRAEFRRVNVDGTRGVMEAALTVGVRKVVNVSTAAVWGHVDGPITEAVPFGLSCASEYARTKRAGDAVAWHLYEQNGLPLVGIYPAAVFGPDDPKATGRYITRLAAGHLPAQVCTSHTFSLVHVRDVADAILRALERPDNIGARYLLCAATLTFGELNHLIATAAGTALPRWSMPDWMTTAGAAALTAGATVIRRPPPLDLALDQVRFMRQGFHVDGSLAERELGLCYTPLDQGIREVVTHQLQPA